MPALSFLMAVAARTASDIINAHVEVLVADRGNMSFAKITVEHRVILVRRRHYILRAKSAVAEPHMPGCGSVTTAPAAL